MESSPEKAPGYAELHCLSNFSFLRGASHPEELVQRAAQLGYTALAITDECSLAGVVRAHMAAKQCGIKLVVGSEIQLIDGLKLVLLATSHKGYSNLCGLITRGRLASAKGSYRLSRKDLGHGLGHCLALFVPDAQPNVKDACWLAERFPNRTWIAVELHCGSDDRAYLQTMERLSAQTGLPLVASGDVHMHVRSRRALQDTVTAIRLDCTLEQAGSRLFCNGERHLRSRSRLARTYPAKLLEESTRIARQCHFSLDELNYQYPCELVPPDRTPSTHLRQLTERGIRQRWPEGIPARVRLQIDKELALIEEMGYEHYFLTVHDVVEFARSQGILCQGRGSAANSAVCFCLGITEVDPARQSMLFERFISKERNEPPDIDVDFEHERREQVIQYLYRKYGRHRAALAAAVITYRLRSAVRDVGKALGLSRDQVDSLAKSLAWWDGKHALPERIDHQGLDPQAPLMKRLVQLVRALVGFPRHLSQHVGGFVISQAPLSQLVPLENAAMADRTVIQWDKDDLEALGLLKVDCLALGMLTAIHRAFDLIHHYRAIRHTMATIPADDSQTYEMICRADTMGVFQIESRAQMAMLPRMLPKRFYDLVIEVAIVRPGPIQGGMVHPYLRRRQGLEPVTYPDPAFQEVLARTLGVPIFQEQVMQLAIAAAGFTPGEADQLRRSMAAWRRRGSLEHFHKRLLEGMVTRGYSAKFAAQLFEQIRGFGSYGFPESHAASFALLVYVSAWLKCHEPAAFTCALLNSQPMGFYSPSQLIQDVRRHGIEVRPVDVDASQWHCTLVQGKNGEAAIQLGLRMVGNLSQQAAERLLKERVKRPFATVSDLVHRAALSRRDREALARAGALRGLTEHRHQAFWQIRGVEHLPGLLAEASVEETPVDLPRPTEAEDITADYRSMGLTLGRHPLALLRPRLRRMHTLTAAEWAHLTNGRSAHVAGIVTMRQRPSTASGVMFVTLEDETGLVNVIIWPQLVERYRQAVLGSRLMAVRGQTQRQGEVRHLVASRVEDHTRLLGRLLTRSRDFH